ncbi:GRP family sugar transporter [Tetragenococcus halophilus]|uniref:GRP family sugar transporter n=1 Tax=Tetragenococcus halophilus TaxID=51669 RepID=UPI0020945A07|nr:GRP family sugar transporter [Tetragenococcus halophilus]MCO7027397.1 GRP family sugar transporter [Tetragenococcus halophilus]
MGNILLALVPAVMWGIQPLILQTIGGKTSNQQMGMSLGALIFSMCARHGIYLASESLVTGSYRQV